MKCSKNILFLFFALISSASYSQTVFWTETFDGVVCAAGSGCDPSIVAWTVTSTGAEGANANKFYISCQENGNAAGTCGSGCGTNQTLHIGNVPTSAAAFLFCPTGDCGAAYDASGAGEVTNTRAESPTASSVGFSTISVSFDYIERGQTTLDNATLWYFDGSTWTLVEDMPKTNNTGCLGQGRWTARTVALPAGSNNNPNLKVGFRWVNNGDGTGSDPSFAVNDVRLLYSISLPVQISSFDAKMQNNQKVKLSWSTETETNNDYFTVERSENGFDFYPISFIDGAGNSNLKRDYTAFDSDLPDTRVYYRLKQTDFNGEFSYSHSVTVNETIPTSARLFIYPNPASISIIIQSDNMENKIEYFQIVNLDGKICKVILTENESETSADISNLTAGIYFVTAQINGVFTREKLIIIK